MISNILRIRPDEGGTNFTDFEVLVNHENEVFFGADDGMGTFFVLDFSDWNNLKEYIDAEFEKRGIHG
jgi:hypothetical protein